MRWWNIFKRFISLKVIILSFMIQIYYTWFVIWLLIHPFFFSVRKTLKWLIIVYWSSRIDIRAFEFSTIGNKNHACNMQYTFHYSQDSDDQDCWSSLQINIKVKNPHARTYWCKNLLAFAILIPKNMRSYLAK